MNFIPNFTRNYPCDYCKETAHPESLHSHTGYSAKIHKNCLKALVTYHQTLQELPPCPLCREKFSKINHQPIHKITKKNLLQIDPLLLKLLKESKWDSKLLKGILKHHPENFLLHVIKITAKKENEDAFDHCNEIITEPVRQKAILFFVKKKNLSALHRLIKTPEHVELALFRAVKNNNLEVLKDLLSIHKLPPSKLQDALDWAWEEGLLEMHLYLSGLKE